MSPDENRPGTLHVGGVVAGSLSQPGAASLLGHLHLDMAVQYTLHLEMAVLYTLQMGLVTLQDSTVKYSYCQLVTVCYGLLRHVTATGEVTCSTV